MRANRHKAEDFKQGAKTHGVSSVVGDRPAPCLKFRCAKPLVGARKLCVLKGYECRVGGPGQTVSCVTREGWAANRSVLASRSGVNTEFAGGERDSRRMKGRGRYTCREPCWHGRGRPIEAQPSRSHEAIPYLDRAGRGNKGGNAH